ncbi:RNA repair domain-containing protein [Cytophagaceae bacterium DM2B3-1]|uniref:RNA repair domain-containing protein n=1 Tax=Xanthocytophaga flava TaxID=3048013 RepID=A0ABT7CW86_9BACT|nr:poly(A) polymerase [Xanthocytophaga flavus]MDJ1497980.1 RNA repair domain-containing protein [Xanthocytophaga flavus]
MKAKKKDGPKEKFITSHEIIHRILWDPRLNPQVFVIGFLDRMSASGLREKPLLEWDENGEIPWHRIRYVRCGEVIVWDREQRIDLFTGDQLPETVWNTEPETVNAPVVVFKPASVYGYRNGKWQIASEKSEVDNPKKLRIATYNVLTNRFDGEDATIHKRIPAIIEQLQESEAEVICLQEVTTLLLSKLLEQCWVQKMYISAIGETFAAEQGLLLLSIFPFSLTSHSFSSHKGCLVGSLQLAENSIHIAVVHLTSNRAVDAEKIRTQQISVVRDYLYTLSGATVIAGDFNAREEMLEPLLQKEWKDCWDQLYPDQPGYTFDPAVNPLAASNTLSGYPGRLDRILIRSVTRHWIAEQVDLFGNKPVEGTYGQLYPSDHFGVYATLAFHTESVRLDNDTLTTLQPTYQSAIVVIPPESLWGPIQAIRKQYDSKVARWMPHITLVYGFIPDEYFSSATALLAKKLTRLRPFDVTLTGYEAFTHRNNITAWLKPETETAGQWQELQSALQELFPQCNEQISRTTGFTPHLSVGQFANEQQAQKVLPEWEPVSFQVSQIALISRKGDNPFSVRYRIYLESGQIEQVSDSSLTGFIEKSLPLPTSHQKEQQQVVLSIIEQACSDVIGQHTRLYTLGSARLGIQSITSDTDVVCLIPEGVSQADFLQNVQIQLEGIYQKARFATDVQIPALRLSIEGQQIDLLCANYRLFSVIPAQITEDRMYDFDSVSWQAVSGCLEADRILEEAQKYVSLEEFRLLVRAVKLWATKRKIQGNGWGYLGSFSWTVLALWSCKTYQPKKGRRDAETLLMHFFQAVSQHDWRIPIGITEESKNFRVRGKRDQMPVVTAVKPVFNSARNVTTSTFWILKTELSHAYKRMQSNWTDVFAEQTIPEDNILILKLDCQTEEELELCCGWIEGHIVGFIISLEELGLFVRPYPGFAKSQITAQTFLELQLTEQTDKNGFAQKTAEFIHQFESWEFRSARSLMTVESRWVIQNF